ncbi:MAG: hypothetical protein DRP10_01050 [Candidatus Aenigmatarchaeota archaeon]|nr:MAG: hypothetical protein DRP10_01050 [Candidatus Aenigmarchaeota archaeon]
MKEEYLDKICYKKALDFFNQLISQNNFPYDLDEINEIKEEAISLIKTDLYYSKKEKELISNHLRNFFREYKANLLDYHKTYV